MKGSFGMTAIDDCQMYQIELPTSVLSAGSTFDHLNNSSGILYFILEKLDCGEPRCVKFDLQHWMGMVNFFYAYKIFAKKTF